MLKKDRFLSCYKKKKYDPIDYLIDSTERYNILSPIAYHFLRYNQEFFFEFQNAYALKFNYYQFYLIAYYEEIIYSNIFYHQLNSNTLQVATTHELLLIHFS